MNWLKWIRQSPKKPPNRRDAERVCAPLLAFYWTGGAQPGSPVRDISPEGALIETSDYWGPGTLINIRLQEETPPAWRSGGTYASSSINVVGIVVRHQANGMAVRFLFESPKQKRDFSQYLSALQSRVSAPRGLVVMRRQESGFSFVEFALLLPVLFILFVNTVNFGGFLFAWITMASAARTGSQYASLAGASVNGPGTAATSTQIYNLVSQDISSLRNRASLAVRVCVNQPSSGTSCSTTGIGTFSNPASDARAEANYFVTTWVDVLYTYQPLLPLFDFPNLGVHATLPATTIHRQSVMRRLQ